MADEFGNTGATMAAPRATGASSAVDSLFKIGTGAPSASSAPDTQSAPQTPAQPRSGTTSPYGNPLGSLAPGMPKVPAPSFGGVLADQYRSILGTAYETARRRMRLGPGGEQKQNPFADAGSVFGQLMGGALNGAQAQTQTMQPAQPQPAQTMQNLGAETPKEQTKVLPSAQAQTVPQVRMSAPPSYARSFGASPRAVIDVGGFEVPLDNNIKTDDANAVSAAAKEAEDGIDWMRENGYLYE